MISFFFASVKHMKADRGGLGGEGTFLEALEFVGVTRATPTEYLCCRWWLTEVGWLGEDRSTYCQNEWICWSEEKQRNVNNSGTWETTIDIGVGLLEFCSDRHPNIGHLPSYRERRKATCWDLRPIERLFLTTSTFTNRQELWKSKETKRIADIELDRPAKMATHDSGVVLSPQISWAILSLNRQKWGYPLWEKWKMIPCGNLKFPYGGR